MFIFSIMVIIPPMFFIFDMERRNFFCLEILYFVFYHNYTGTHGGCSKQTGGVNSRNVEKNKTATERQLGLEQIRNGPWQYINKFCPDFFISSYSPLSIEKIQQICSPFSLNSFFFSGKHFTSGDGGWPAKVAAPPRRKPKLTFFLYFFFSSF